MDLSWWCYWLLVRLFRASRVSWLYCVFACHNIIVPPPKALSRQILLQTNPGLRQRENDFQYWIPGSTSLASAPPSGSYGRLQSWGVPRLNSGYSRRHKWPGKMIIKITAMLSSSSTWYIENQRKKLWLPWRRVIGHGCRPSLGVIS